MNEYKKLAHLNIDDIEPVEVSEFEKKRVKKHVLGTKRSPKLFKNIAIATAITIGATVATSFAFPSFASQIPFVQNVISYFNDKDSIYSNYNDFATEIGQVQTSNGVSVMIENAVFDGTSLTISYALETELDLGDMPSVKNYLDIKGADAMGGGSTIKKINETTYVGLDKMVPHFKDGKRDEIIVSWKPEAFISYETGEKVKGDWQFDFSISKLEGEIQLVNQAVTNDGITILINSIEKSDMSAVINYEHFVDQKLADQWMHTTISLEVKDDLGKVYAVQGNGGVSYDDGLSYKWSETMNTIDPNAQKLIIYPTVYFSAGSGEMKDTQELDEIVVELK